MKSRLSKCIKILYTIKNQIFLVCCLEVSIIGTYSETEKRVYEVEDIQEILKIGRTKVYSFIQEAYKQQKPFKVIKIGNIYRIPKASFDRWLDEDN